MERKKRDGEREGMTGRRGSEVEGGERWRGKEMEGEREGERVR